MSGEPDTSHRILDAAERLFAEYGITTTSLRTVTSEAGVNLAAVHYHFGSKDGLVLAVFSRRLGPLNAERSELLAAAEAGAVGEAPEVERVVQAFVGPTLRLRQDPGGARFLKLMGRLFAEAGELADRIFQEQLSAIAERFVAALRKALPHLPVSEIYWRSHWVVGAMAHTLACDQKLQLMSGGRCDSEDVDGVLRRLVGFLAAGLRSPMPAGIEDGSAR